MKRPQPLFFSESGPAQKRVFIKECENWITLEDTNRSYECLAAAAFKYGVSYPDNEKVKEARDIYAMLVKYSSDYQARLDMANKVLKSTDELQDKIRGILRKDTEL